MLSRKQILSNLRSRRSFQTALAASATVCLYRTLLRIFSLKKNIKSIPPSFLAGLFAGLALALHPADTRRITITIYFLTRTLEFCYNLLDDKGYLFSRAKPWWFGSWLIFPFASAQLLHAFIFDSDCFPPVCLIFLTDLIPRDMAISSSNILLHISLNVPTQSHHPVPGQIAIKSSTLLQQSLN